MSQKHQVHKRIVPLFMVEVFEAYQNKQMSLQAAMKELQLSRSSFFKYYASFKKDPNTVLAPVPKRKGNRRFPSSTDEKIVALLRAEKELVWNPSVRVGKVNFAALSEELQRTEKLAVSSETIRRKAVAWKLHNPRERGVKIYREVETSKVGRLFQHDTCIHQWSPYMNHFYLILTVDDHSRRIVFAKFFEEETSMNHILSVRDAGLSIGLPLAYYTDRHSIFTYNPMNGPVKQNYQTMVEDPEIQWKRVMALLGIQGICANSPQAKGKVESKFKYLQGRMVRRCAKEQVTTLEHVQRILDEEVRYYNEYKKHEVTGQTPMERFLLAEKEGRSVLRKIPEGKDLKDLFCLEYVKKLDKYGRTSVKGIPIELKSSPSSEVIIRYIKENGEVELRILSGTTVLKSIKV